MFNKFLKLFFILFCILMILYLALPNYSFPVPPPDSLQSQEPADTETPLRRAYFTNYTRSEVLNWYQNQFEEKDIFGIKIPSYLLNYPPEDSQTIIRDQTRSTFLEEAVHPFRESIYINGFEPKDPKDAIFIGGRLWRQKIIIRFVSSNVLIRELIFLLSMAMATVIYNAFRKSLKRKNE